MAAFPEVSPAASSPERIAEVLANPGFAKYFTDNVAQALYTTEQGWHDRSIRPLESVGLHPGAAVLHFGQEIFEGLKAYRHADNSIWLFRPEANAARFVRSAERLAMVPVPEDDFVDSVRALVATEQAWVPSPEGEQSLYLRPLLFATEPMLAPYESGAYTYLVLAAPAGPYYPAPLTLWLTRNFARSGPGGTGAAKCGGNYAASYAADREAAANGCHQVLWLDGATGTQVEECGTMNFLAVTADGELVTPALTGTILPGITRDSLLKIAPSHDLTPVERTLTLDELRTRVADGTITETFACGTAGVVTPIVGFKGADFALTVGDGSPGHFTRELRAHLTGIQFGLRDDEHGWMQRVV